MIPTLGLMAEVYALSTAGGADSPRFRHYVSLNAARHPLGEFNPMTSKPGAAETVEHLLSIDAEGVVGDVAGAEDIFISVLTPGAWTDDVFTELERRMVAPGSVGVWAGETPDAEEVARLTRMSLARRRWQEHNGRARSLRPLASQEGYAAVSAGPPAPDGDGDAGRMVLEVVGDTDDRGTLIAWLMGDEKAASFGDTGVGLGPGDGLRCSWEWASDLEPDARLLSLI